MQGKISLAVVSAVLLGFAGAAQAGDMGKKSSAMKQLDQNGNGKVSLEEAKAAGASELTDQFKKYDANGNETLEPGEFARFEAEHGGKIQYKSRTKEKEMMENE
jgi:hypothetical protein